MRTKSLYRGKIDYKQVPLIFTSHANVCIKTARFIKATDTSKVKLSLCCQDETIIIFLLSLSED